MARETVHSVWISQNSHKQYNNSFHPQTGDSKAGTATHDEHRVRIFTPDDCRFDEREFPPADEIHAALGLGKYMAGLDLLRAAHAAGRGDVLHRAQSSGRV